MHSVPSDVLGVIFSFLEPKDLARVSRVSFLWNQVQKTESLWKNHYLSYLDDPAPSKISWKERFIVIHHWMVGKADIKAFPCSFKKRHCDHPFTISNNTPYEIIRNSNHPSIYFIKNWETEKLLAINLEFYGVEVFIAEYLAQDAWYALDVKGNILCFDLEKGDCIKKISLQDFDHSVDASFLCTADEIIISNIGKVIIWNSDGGKLQEIDADLCVVTDSTPNFILCRVDLFGTYHRIVALHKKSSTSTVIAECPRESWAVSGPYLAIALYGGRIVVYKDVGESLNLIHDFLVFDDSDYRTDSLCIYKNWLLISSKHAIYVYDIKTARKLFTLKNDQDHLELRTNVSKLFMRYSKRNSEGEEYFYKLYNFEKLC